MFIMIEKLHIQRCIVIIFHKIQPMVQLSLDTGLQSVHIFCLLSLNLFLLAIFLIGVYSLRFWMSHSLYLRIVHAVERHDDYFVQKRDRNGRLGFLCLQKITAAFMMTSQRVYADFMDHYIKIGETTVIESLIRFVRAVIEVFGGEYLRSPNNHDTIRLL
jgi:hypothetical protein